MRSMDRFETLVYIAGLEDEILNESKGGKGQKRIRLFLYGSPEPFRSPSSGLEDELIVWKHPVALNDF
ncbi:hypothetical protein TNCV_768101 [Trichonephila clavipes]|nr:hypothetical protein TNCV_768101 [Trichonephila clavipes]